MEEEGEREGRNEVSDNLRAARGRDMRGGRGTYASRSAGAGGREAL